MESASLERNHSRWAFTSLRIICMVSTFALGWYFLQEFLSELLQSRDKDKLYGDIMHTGLIVCIFNMSKFYLLPCFGKKLEIVDLVDSVMDGNSTEENDEVQNAYEDDRDDHEGETQCQAIMKGQHTQSQGLQREQGGGNNRADVNIDAEQNQKEQNLPEIQDSQDLEDGTNRQNNEQMQGQIGQDYESNEERVSAPDDNPQVHMQDSGNKNIPPRRSTRNVKLRERFRSQSMSEVRQDDQNIEPRKLQRSKEDPGPSKSSPKKQKHFKLGENTLS